MVEEFRLWNKLNINLKALSCYFQTHVNPYRIVPELSYDNNILNCDIYFDGEDVDVGSCNIGNSPK